MSDSILNRIFVESSIRTVNSVYGKTAYFLRLGRLFDIEIVAFVFATSQKVFVTSFLKTFPPSREFSI